MRKEFQAILVAFVVVGLGLVYMGYRVSTLETQLAEQREITSTAIEALRTQLTEQAGEASTAIEALRARISKLKKLILECGVTIDNGTDVSTEVVYMTKGATALEALRRIAVVETTYSAGLGEFIDSINGLANDPDAGKYWMWYIWSIETSAWELAPVGAGNYKLVDGDNIKFSYEIPTW